MMAQLICYHHVPYLEAVAQCAGAPGVDNQVHIKKLLEQGHRHGGIDLTNPGLDQDYVLARELTLVEGVASHSLL